MGGGTSRLDVTDWEAADGGCRRPVVVVDSVVGASVNDEMGVAAGENGVVVVVEQQHRNDDNDDDSCCDALPAIPTLAAAGTTLTLEGAPPTRKYGLYELQKTSVGQRAFDVVDGEGNVLLTTKPVPKTLAWFDVCGPGSVGDFVDYRLRVQALDHFRRTWIVYRYHEPCFEGQRPANPAQFEGKIADGVKLYKSACITVSWSRYVAVAARYGPPDPADFVEDDSLQGSSYDGDPLFSQASEIAAKSREKHEHKDVTDATSETNTDDTNDKSDDAVEDTEANEDQIQSTELIADEVGSDTTIEDAHEIKATSAPPPSDQKPLPVGNVNGDSHLPASTAAAAAAATTSSTKRRSSKLPATTLTQLAASNSSNSLASSAIRRTSVKTQQLREYFGSSKSITGSSASSRFGSRFFSKSAVSEDNDQDDNQTDEAKGESNDNEIATAISAATSTAESEAEPQQSLEELYEEALEGVIDLDNQPIVQCQEIYNKMLGNHQTMILTKEELFALLRLDEAQHEEQLQQERSHGEQADNGYNSPNPIEQAVELDEKHLQPQASRTSRLISRFSSLRSQNVKANGTDNSATSDSMEKNAANTDSDDKFDTDHNNANGESMRSTWKRFFSTKSNEAKIALDTDAPQDLAASLEQSQQSTEIENVNAAFSARETMPSLMDDATSNNSSAQDLSAVEHDGHDEDAGTKSSVSNKSDRGEGPGVNKGNDWPLGDANDTESNGEDEATNLASNGTTGEPQNHSADSGTPQNPPVDDHPNPLVSYWFWKHTTFNFQQHKMHMHLAKNSDLALHVILAIIVNQVRSERNHTVFATTGLHPAWFFIDLRNPKAMFQ